MDLSIIIVNWNSAEETRHCLESIRKHCADLNLEIIVVDNGSYDGCSEMISGCFPEVRFVQSDTNLGFGKACNLGCESSIGRVLLFLNPDTKVIGSSVSVMLSYVDSHPTAGIVGCRLVNADMTLQTSCIQPFPTILNQAIDLDFLKNLFPRLEIWGMKPLYDGAETAEVQAVSGACLMIKREVFQAVGCFSDEYFMYGEDLDLCFKVREAGWKVEFLHGAQVIHHGAQSSKKSSRGEWSSILIRESVFRFLKKTRGVAYAGLYRLSMILVAFLRVFLIIAMLILPRGEQDKDSLKASYRKWKSIFRWTIGLESWAKKPA